MKQRGFLTLSTIPWIITAVAIALAFLFFQLYRSTVNEYAQFRADVESAQNQVRIDNERKLAALERANRELDAGWINAMRDLDRLGRTIRVRPHRCPGALPSVSDGSGASDAAAAERGISPEQCEAIANNAVTDAAQVMWLQQWIKQAHEATK